MIRRVEDMDGVELLALTLLSEPDAVVTMAAVHLRIGMGLEAMTVEEVREMIVAAARKGSRS
jgi:hypothetical protein